MRQNHGYSAPGTMHPYASPMGQQQIYANQYSHGHGTHLQNLIRPRSNAPFGEGSLVVPSDPMSATSFDKSQVCRNFSNMPNPEPQSDAPPSYDSLIPRNSRRLPNKTSSAIHCLTTQTSKNGNKLYRC